MKADKKEIKKWEADAFWNHRRNCCYSDPWNMGYVQRYNRRAKILNVNFREALFQAVTANKDWIYILKKNVCAFTIVYAWSHSWKIFFLKVGISSDIRRKED